MANLATTALKDTLAVLQARETKVITTCSSAWWADRAKIGLPSNASPGAAVGQTAAVTHDGTWLIRYDAGYSEKHALRP